ncbi:MAG: DinB family protein [Ginsengibacter sp.]
MDKTYRHGAAGALLDEYERALSDFKNIVNDISNEQLVTIVDPDTEDTRCRSVQTILSHVVSAGYKYAVYIRRSMGIDIDFPEAVTHINIKAYLHHLDDMFAFTLDTFKEINDSQLEQPDNSKKMMTSWRQCYDIEQLVEHAIVHILRHRRQIEKFKIILSKE